MGRPKESAAVRITCEINFPLIGIDRRIGGAILEDTSGELVIAHRGNIGGGRSGIGKNLFVDYFRGEWVTAEDGDFETDFALIGALNSSRLSHQVGNFIREVDRIKQSANQEVDGAARRPVLPGFQEEFSGTKRYRGARSIIARSDHGLVVNRLASQFREMGYDVGNDRNRDLYVLGSRRRVLAVFEVKTDTSTTSIYTVIGQLLLNNVNVSGQPKLILLLPEHLSREQRRQINALGIVACHYQWVRGQPVFPDIDAVTN